MIGFCNCKECKQFKLADKERPDVCKECAYEDSLFPQTLGDKGN